MFEPTSDHSSGGIDCSRCLFRNECLSITMHQITPGTAACLARRTGLLIVTEGLLHIERNGTKQTLHAGEALTLPLDGTRILPAEATTDVVFFEQTN